MSEPDGYEIAQRVLNTSFVEYDGLQGTLVYAAWIAVMLTRIAVALGDDDVKLECIALRAEVLIEVEPLYLEWALLRARRECKRLPLPVEIFEFLKEIPGFTMPD